MLRRYLAATAIFASFALLLALPIKANTTVGLVSPAQTVAVPARNLALSCIGAAISSGGKTGTSISQFSRIGQTSIQASFGAPTGTTLQATGNAPIVGYGFRQNVSASATGAGNLVVVDSSGTRVQGSALLTANQTQSVQSAALNGLLSASCDSPSTDFWLLGGSTAVGREALLLLSNPTTVDATANLEIYSETGRIDSPGLTGISVAAGKSTVVPLASFSFRSESLAVRVKVDGGALLGVIQQRAVRGVQAAGADFIGSVPAASAQIVVPGILVRGAAYSDELRSKSSKYLDIEQMLRVFVPGNKNASLTIQVLGVSAKNFGTAISQSAGAGRVTDIDLSGLADGNYFALIKSSVPVQAAVRLVETQRGGNPFSDFTWLNQATPFANQRFIATPKGVANALCLVNSSTEQMKVELTLGNTISQIVLPATSEQVIAVAGGISVGIKPLDGLVSANLIERNASGLANLSVNDDKNFGGTVSVLVH
jgi:hypothetical protein